MNRSFLPDRTSTVARVALFTGARRHLFAVGLGTLMVLAMAFGLTRNLPGGPAMPDAHAAASLSARAPARALAARERALQTELDQAPLGRDTHDIAVDDRLTGLPSATVEHAGNHAWLAADGNPNTAWRGTNGTGPWAWTIPFLHPVHLGLIRLFAGDTAAQGVPAAFRWEYVEPAADGCPAPASRTWRPVPDGAVDDREPNEWVYGPKTIHAQRQVLFTNLDACALRLSITATDDGLGPVLREISLYQSARSLTEDPGARAEASSIGPESGGNASGAIDGTYESFWQGAPGQHPWSLQVDLPAAHTVDRVSLLLGRDATMVPYPDRAGHAYAASDFPTLYHIETRPSADAPWQPLAEGDPPRAHGAPLPVRRRLVRFREPRVVQAVRLVIDAATGKTGAASSAAAPVVRELGLYDAADTRPVISEPLFLSVDTNPAALAHRRVGARPAPIDGSFARDFSRRLRRIVEGYQRDSAWPADDHRPRDASAGRFQAIIEADDPQLDEVLLSSISPPPVVLLSGGSGWEYSSTTSGEQAPEGRFRWDPVATAREPNRGLGQLAGAVRDRVAPFIGFCGGAQNLMLLAARGAFGDLACTQRVCPSHQRVIDEVLARNDNQAIRGPEGNAKWDERAFWADKSQRDPDRPTVHFDPSDPLFSTLAGPSGRDTTRQLPMLHGDMVRLSAIHRLADDMIVAAWTDYCHPWVKQDGPEPTSLDPSHPGWRCVRIPHAFHSADRDRLPLIGFQFHPDAKDLRRLMPGAPPEARGDALNVFANAVDLVIDGYLRSTWPQS